MAARIFILVACLSLLAANAWGQAASRSTYLRVTKVQEAWDAQNYDEALLIIEELIEKTRGDSYDHALVHQYLARHCVLADCPERIRPALDVAMAQKDLPDEMITMLYLFYAQVVLSEGDYAVAADYYERWLASTIMDPGPEHLFSASYANFEIKNYDRAEELVVRAIENGKPALLNWSQLRYEILMAMERPGDAESVAAALVEEHPTSEKAWQLLGNHYLRIEEMERALPIFAIAWSQGILRTDMDAKRIVSLYSYVETPERAARLMESLVEDAFIEEDFDTLKRIGELWLLSRERTKAIAALSKAADFAEDGKTDEMLAGIHFEEEQWVEAHARYLRAIERGAAEENSRIHLLAGVAAWRAGMNSEARVSLNEALKHDDVSNQARSVLRQMDRS